MYDSWINIAYLRETKLKHKTFSIYFIFNLKLMSENIHFCWTSRLPHYSGSKNWLILNLQKYLIDQKLNDSLTYKFEEIY